MEELLNPVCDEARGKAGVGMLLWYIVPQNGSHTRGGSRKTYVVTAGPFIIKSFDSKIFFLHDQNQTQLMWCSLVWISEGLATSLDFLLGVLY